MNLNAFEESRRSKAVTSLRKIGRRNYNQQWSISSIKGHTDQEKIPKRLARDKE
jgi:hypothetical protein